MFLTKVFFFLFSDYSTERARDEYIRGDYNINSDSQYDKLSGLYAPPGYERDKTHSHVTIDRDAMEREGMDRDRARDRSQLAQIGEEKFIFSVVFSVLLPNFFDSTFPGDTEWERERERTQHRHIQHDRTERERWQHSYLPTNTIDRERERERERERDREREREQREKEREEEWERERAAHMASKVQVPTDTCNMGMSGMKDNSSAVHNEPTVEKAALQPFLNLGSRGKDYSFVYHRILFMANFNALQLYCCFFQVPLCASI